MSISPLRSYRLLMVGLFTLLGVMGLWLPAQIEVALASPSSTITVNSPADVVVDDGVCTLREAITAANTDTPSGATMGECIAGSGTDTIVFSDMNSPFTATLAISGTREDGNATGDLDIFSDVTIQGNPAFTTTIDANQLDRVLDVLTGTVVVEHIALYNGHAPNANQECNGNSLDAESGGGVRSQGTLTIRASQIISNTTGQGDTILCKPAAWTGGDGGGIWSDGTLVVTDTTIIHNRTGNGGGNFATCGTGGLPGSPGGSGAGIYAIGIAIIEQSLITQNKAGAGGIAIDISDGPSTGGQGGGLYSSGSLILSDTTVSYNESGKGGNGAVPFGGPGDGCDGDSGGNGGGVYTTGEITVTNSTIIHNLTREGGEGGEGGPLPYEPGVSGMPGAGGGMFVNDQVLILTSRLGQNVSAGDGGGIMNMGTLRAEQNTFDENSASNGGGIHNNGVFTSIRNTINGNSAYSFGGIYTVGTLTLESSTVSGNTSQNNSGGIGIFDGTTILRNSTVTHNRGLPSGGIGGSIDATVRLENTIVADNFLGETDSPFDCSGLEIVSLGYLFMRAVEQCEYHANIGDILNQSVHLLPLADNGGNTFTHAFAEGSLAIDRGYCSTATTDQRGELRPVDLPDFPNGSGNDCDIGALESQPPKTYPTRTATPTFTPSPTPIATETSTSTPTPTPTITPTPSNTPTATQIPLPTYTPYPTYTPFPTWTPPAGLRELYLPLIRR